MIAFDVAALPIDHARAPLAGRIAIDGVPVPVLVRDAGIYDVSRSAATSADLFDLANPAALAGERICHVADLTVGGGRFELLAPIDLQCVKACGVTFAVSAIERVIEERARGDADKAASIRCELEDKIGGGIRSVVPGSDDAARLKAALIEAGMWSQYLEVAIGPDAEVFTKAPVLSSLGWGAELGFRSDSTWNNPEPEVVLVANAAGKAIGAILLYRKIIPPFVNMGSLLLAPLGGAIALLVTGNPLSLPVLIGVLMLLGIVGKNSILLVDFAIEEMARGVPRKDAILDAGHKRAQPILMTTVAMVAGMVPTALSLTGDGAWRAPMAVTVIGGLILSTLLTLLIVPATFSLAVGLEQSLGPRLKRWFTTGGAEEPTEPVRPV